MGVARQCTTLHEQPLLPSSFAFAPFPERVYFCWLLLAGEPQVGHQSHLAPPLYVVVHDMCSLRAGLWAASRSHMYLFFSSPTEWPHAADAPATTRRRRRLRRRCRRRRPRSHAATDGGAAVAAAAPATTCGYPSPPAAGVTTPRPCRHRRRQTGGASLSLHGRPSGRDPGRP